MAFALREGTRSIALSLLAATALASGPAFSQSFVISGPTTGPKVMNGDGDTGVVKSGGAITTSDPGDSAVEMNNAEQKLTNDGTVEATGDEGSAVASYGDRATITNSGSMQTTGLKGTTVYSEGDHATITNNASMLATGARSTVVFSEGDNSVIVNNGSVSATNDAIGGIGSKGNNSRIANNGTIKVTRDGTGGDDDHRAAGILTTGDRTVVTNGGKIVTDGSYSLGAVIRGADAELANNGSIETFGDASVALTSTGANATVVNSGTIETSGGASAGMYLQGAGSVGKNAGTIETTGPASFGMLVGSADPKNPMNGSTGAVDVSVSNSGSIRTTGDSSFGILLFGDRGKIGNSGSIDVTGPGAAGIFVQSTDATVVNGGSIHVSGDVARGVDMGALGGVALSNRGAIVVDGMGATGVLSVGDHATVTNSGTIKSSGDAAIRFGGNNATLNLLAGTRIQGEIRFNGTGNTATFGSGLNAMMTFSGTGVPTIIRTDGLPFVVSGNTVAVLDTSGFGTAGSVVADLTGNIAGAIEDRLALVRRERIVGAALGLRGSHGMGAGEEGAVATGIGPAFWVTGIGGYRKQNGSGGDLDFHTSLGGVVVGVDTDINEFWRGGVFLGGAGGSSHVDGSDQDFDNSSFFGGGYLGYAAGLNFADLSLSIGSLRQDGDRRIANNMVDGGLETAHARSNGTYVSPALTVGTHVIWNDTMFVPSLRLRYAGLFLDGYSETGGADALRVDSRDVHVFEARGQIALPLAPYVTPNGIWETTLRAGIDGIAQSRGNVSATLLGQDIDFTPAGRRSAVRGFAGADFNFITDSRMQLQASVEAGYGSDSAFIATARAGLSIPF
ncbi:uncharacterized protein with beta-barrel porin domain [Mesorhizobium soli]|uniref:autotransporter outer membrane beta-barrel domain-containing protein n=1 Tax=Pseudaminobacter soli (ex Li et al. 2025) TaxID=1295366 RepID=UPI0024730DC2|nr:autotransporter outer membrane beta-barrel domain-containing protein [Mesorhizobium soli]MDH6234481.1 uncharacterized protein with beta-barrel porin domain [Mesorhizobium soli]